MGIEHKTNGEPRGKAVVLLSGGIDSATTLAVAQADGYEAHTLSFDYGQRHRFELNAARAVAEHLGVRRHMVMEIDFSQIGHSALTAEIAVPKGRGHNQRASEIPVTYVPGRNTVFLSIALAWAETLAADSIFIGANAIDYSGYPDCRPEFIQAFQEMANLATKTGIEGNRIIVNAPLINMTKAQIIREGSRLGLDYSLTFSCYDPDRDGNSCGDCDSCTIRRQGFAEAGVKDPTSYIKSVT